MSLVEILGVSLSKLDSDRLWSRHIDLPKPNTQTEASAVEIMGWVLGKSSPAVAVELIHDGKVIRRMPLNHRRPDIAKARPDVSWAENSGFHATVSLLGATLEFDLSVQAALQDRSRVPLGAIRGRRRWREEDYGVGAPLVSVIIPCYNQAHFLGEAIESVLAQTYPHFEVVVIDDGSTDNTQEVAARYPGVRCIRQENSGLAAARNTGIRHTNGSYLVFLDADDRLLPDALEAGLTSLQAHPECAFVAGRYRYIAFDGSPLLTPQPPRVERDHYLALLRENFIATPAVVMYRRRVLKDVGVFDASMRGCEDYELYLRVAREYRVYCYDKMVAEYREHGANMRRDDELLWKSGIKALRAQWPYVKRQSNHHKEAYKMAVRYWQEYYGERLVDEVRTQVRERKWRRALRGLLTLLRYYPPWQRRGRPPVGWVRFGSLRRLTPINRNFGWDRGGPIDRYYIEDFLARHTEDIRGRVLEIQNASYTRKFGGDRVTTSDVLDVAEDNRQANIHADLTCADHVPSDAFDCIILTQTLHVIYDVHSVIQTLYRILKPGGVLLATFPGISQVDWTDQWYWSFTVRSARRLFEEVFPEENVVVETHGNALAATAFLQGLGVGELRQEELEFRDPDYEFLIAIKAVKPKGHNGWSLSPRKNQDE